MLKLLRYALIWIGIILPILGTITVAMTFRDYGKPMLDGPFAWPHMAYAYFENLFQNFALGLLCIFAAHKIKPFGGSND